MRQRERERERESVADVRKAVPDTLGGDVTQTLRISLRVKLCFYRLKEKYRPVQHTVSILKFVLTEPDRTLLRGSDTETERTYHHCTITMDVKTKRKSFTGLQNCRLRTLQSPL